MPVHLTRVRKAVPQEKNALNEQLDGSVTIWADVCKLARSIHVYYL